MMWQDFKDRIVARLDVMEVRLNFRLNVDVRAWSDLSCEADFVGAMTLVRDKCPLRRTRGVVMEVKNMVSDRLSMTNKALTFRCERRPHQSHVRRGRRNEVAMMIYPLRPHRTWKKKSTTCVICRTTCSARFTQAVE